VVQAPPVAVDEKHDERVRVLDGMVKRLKTYVAELEEEVKTRDYEIRRLTSRLRTVHTTRDAALAKDVEVATRDAIIQSIKKRLRKEERHNQNLVKRLVRIKKFAELSMEGDVVPVKVMEALTKEGLRKLIEDVGLSEGELVYVGRTDGWGRSVVKDLAGLRVRAVILSMKLPEEGDPQLLPAFRDAAIPLLTAAETGTQVRGKQGLCGKDALESALRTWQDAQAVHEREKKTALIEHIFKEYKSERGKEVKKGG